MPGVMLLCGGWLAFVAAGNWIVLVIPFPTGWRGWTHFAQLDLAAAPTCMHGNLA